MVNKFYKNFIDLEITNNNIIVQDNNFELYDYIKTKLNNHNIIQIDNKFKYNPLLHISKDKNKCNEEINIISEAMVDYCEESYDYGYLYDCKRYFISTVLMYIIEMHLERSIDEACCLSKYALCYDENLNFSLKLPPTSLTVKYYRLYNIALNKCIEHGYNPIKEILTIIMFWNTQLSKERKDCIAVRYKEPFVIFANTSPKIKFLFTQLPSIIKLKKINIPIQFIIADNINPSKISLHDIATSRNYEYSFQIKYDNDIYKKIYGGQWESFFRLLNKEIII